MKTGQQIVQSLRKQIANPIGSIGDKFIKPKIRISLEDQVAWWQNGGHFNVELYNKIIKHRA